MFEKLKNLTRSQKTAAGIGAALLVGGAVALGVLLPGQKTPEAPGANQPKDTSALAVWLEKDGTDSMVLDEDVELNGLCYVNGNKTLTGAGTIRMTVDGEYMMVLQNGATLTLAGPTLDGTDNAQNGIYVDQQATLNLQDGALTNFTGHGVRVLGAADVTGGGISHVGTNWMVVDTGAEAAISEGSFTGAGTEGILTAEGSNVTLGKDVTMSEAKNSLLYNAGTMEVTSGSYTASGAYAFHNEGTMTVDSVNFAGATVLGYIENTADGTITVENGSMADSKADFIFNQGYATVSGVSFNQCASSAIENRGVSSEMVITNCTFDNIGKNVFLSKNTVVTAKDISVGSCGGYVAHNRASQFNGKNVTANKVGESGFLNDFAQDGDKEGCGTLTLDGFEIGSAKNYGIRMNGGKADLRNGTVGVTGDYSMYVKNGEAITDTVSFKGVEDKAKAVVLIGQSSAPAGVVTMNNTNITGGARGISNNGELTFNSGRIYGNHTNEDSSVGGGINNRGTLVVNGGVITGNYALSSGGGIYNQGICTINGGTVTGNYTEASGGGVATKTDGLRINGGVVTNNEAANYGGGVFVGEEGQMHYYGGTVESNRAGKSGGGIGVSGKAWLHGGTVAANISQTGGGGGVYNGGKGEVELCGITVSGNACAVDKSGGGVMNIGRMTISDGLITGNTAGTFGGGVSNSVNTDGTVYGDLRITGGTIYANHAHKGGGGVYNTAVARMSGGAILENDIETTGSAIYTTYEFHMNGGTINGHEKGLEATPYDVYIYKGVVCLSGHPDFNSVYVAANGKIEIEDNIDIGHPYKLFLNNYRIGYRAVDGRAYKLIEPNKVKFELPKAQRDKGRYIDNDGLIAGYVEAELWRDGKCIDEGLFTGMRKDAENGDTIVLKKDVVLDENVDFGNSRCVTITDDFNHHSITVKGGNKCGLYMYGNNKTTITGTSYGGITIEGRGEATTAGIVLTGNAELTIDGNVELKNFTNVGTGESKMTDRTAGKNGSAIYVNSSAKLTMNNVKVTNCSTAGAGGAIYGLGKISISNTTVTGNKAKGSGGGLYCGSKSSLALNSVTFTGNSCGEGKNGKDIYVGGTPATVGGATTIGDVYLNDGDTLAQNRTITFNSTVNAVKSIGVTVANYVMDCPVVAPNAYTAAGAAKITISNGTILVIDPVTGKLGGSTEPTATNTTTGETGPLATILANANSGNVITIDSAATLTSPVTIDKDLTIQGNGNTVDMIAGINIASGAHVTIDNVAFTGAATLETSAIKNAGNLTIQNGTTFTGISAAATGAAINNSGTLTMTGGSITGCKTASSEKGFSGGAIGNTGKATLTNVSITGNDTTTGSEGGNGGGIQNTSNGELTLDNCTVTGNVCGAEKKGKDIYHSGASLTVTGSTTVGDINLAKDKTVTIGDDASSLGTIGITVSNYVAGTPVITNNANTEAAAGKVTINNGDDTLMVTRDGTLNTGEATDAEIWRNGSKVDNGSLAWAITNAQAGDTIKLTTDVTLDSAATLNKNITIDGQNNTVTLTNSLTVANTATAVTISNTKFTGGATLKASAITNNGGLTITDCTFSGITTSATGAVLNNRSGATLTMNNGSITGCKTTSTKDGNSGGAINNVGTVELNNVSLTGNDTIAGNTGGNGGAIQNASGGVLTLNGCTVTGNTCGAEKKGKDIYHSGASLTISGNTAVDEIFLPADRSITFADTAAADGAIKVKVGNYVAGTQIITSNANTAAAVDKVTMINTGDLTIGTDGVLKAPALPEAELWRGDAKQSSGTLTEMLAAAQAGDTIKLTADATIAAATTLDKNITIDGQNKTVTLTAGLTVDAAATEVKISNIAFTSGGATLTKASAIANYGGLTITDCTFSGITANNTGVVLNNQKGATLTMTGGSITGCKTSGGYSGGAVNNTAGTVTLNNVTLTGNTATNNGGAIQNASNGKMALNGCTINSNTCGSGKYGNDIYHNGTSLTISGNTAVDEIFLPADRSITFADTAAADGAIKVKVGSTNYVAGTQIITGSNTAAAAAKVAMVNGSDLIVGEDGALKTTVVSEAELWRGGSKQSSGTFADMLAAAAADDTIKLGKDVTIAEATTLDKNITIDGQNKTVTLTAGLTVDAAATAVTISNTSFTGGATLTASAIINNGSLTVTGCAIDGIDTGDAGGAVQNNGVLRMEDCSITNNTAAGANGGGAIRNNKTGNATLLNCTITNNKATTGHGGGINNAATLTLDSCTVTGNTVVASKKYGNDIYQNGTLTVSGASTVAELYLPSGKTFSFGDTVAENGAIKVKVGTATYESGKQIITGDNTATAYTKVSMLNTGTPKLAVGPEGTLVEASSLAPKSAPAQQMEETPVTVEATPAEGETAPAEGEAAPAEGEATPAEGETAPTEGEAAPAEGEAAPAEGEAAPAEGETAPVEGEAAPAEGETAPAEEKTSPIDDAIAWLNKLTDKA